MDKKEILKFEPKDVFKHFYDICQIPHGSGKCEKLGKYIYNLFKENNLDVYQDKVGNIYVNKKATKGHENKKRVLMQAHYDMVNVKAVESKHDFDKDPIEIIVESNGRFRANKTTLGADNGIGVAAIIAVMLDKNLEHGPISGLLTVDEETTMLGANEVEIDRIKNNDYLINLDNEDRDQIVLGSSGVIGVHVEYPVRRVKNNVLTDRLRLLVEKGTGGHSGIEIHLKRINAIKFVFARLSQIIKKHEIALVHIHGGLFPNAIPFTCEAIFATKPNAIKDIQELVKKWLVEAIRVYELEDKELKITLTKVDNDQDPISVEDSKELIFSFNSMYNGLMHYDWKYMVPESSTNIGVFRTNEHEFLSKIYSRSPYETMKLDITNMFEDAFRAKDFKISYHNDTPGLLPVKESKIVDIFEKAQLKVTNIPLKKSVTPGGLEISLFTQFLPELSAVAIGPDIKSPHSPHENCDIKSVEDFYNILKEVLKTIDER